MNFATKWGCFQYTVMAFGLKNVSEIFSRVVVAAFKEFIHKFCRQGLMVDSAKIAIILNLQAPRSVKQLHATLGHTGYYQKFIKMYT